MIRKIGKIRKYLIGPILGIFLANALYFVQPEPWVGNSLLKLGQLQSTSTNANLPIESMSVLAERLKSPSFVESVLGRTKRDEIESLINAEGSLRVKPIKNPDRSADSMEISVTGESQELVRIAIEGVVAEIESRHDQIFQSYLKDYISELSILNAETEALRKKMSFLAEREAIKEGRGTGFLMMEVQGGIDSRLNRISILRELTSSAVARPTSRIEAIYITKKPRFLTWWRMCLFGILLGGVINLIWIRSKSGMN